MKQFDHYLQQVRARVNESTNGQLRSVTVKYSDGTVINTSMAAHLTDDQIKDHFKIGKAFNLANAPVEGDGNYGDNIQTVAEVTINDSQPSKSSTQVELTFSHVDEDTGNFVYQGDDGHNYVSLDGQIHDMTNAGEPIAPVRNTVIKKGEPVYNPADRFGRNPGSKIQESGRFDLSSSTPNHAGIKIGDRVWSILGPFAGKDKFYGIVDLAENHELYVTFYDVNTNKPVSGSEQMVYDYVHKMKGVNEGLNKSDLVNILQKYTVWLIKNNHIGTAEAAGLVDAFMTTNESSINETYRVMTVAVPPVEEWKDVQLSAIEGDTAKGFDYMGKTYCMRPKDEEMFRQNWGKLVSFSYTETPGTKYMEFPKVVTIRN